MTCWGGSCEDPLEPGWVEEHRGGTTAEPPRLGLSVGGGHYAERGAAVRVSLRALCTCLMRDSTVRSDGTTVRSRGGGPLGVWVCLCTCIPPPHTYTCTLLERDVLEKLWTGQAATIMHLLYSPEPRRKRVCPHGGAPIYPGQTPRGQEVSE